MRPVMATVTALLLNIPAWADVPPSPADPYAPVKPKMVLVPAGTFTMGCKDGRDNVEGLDRCGNAPEETPAHEVTLDAFQLGKYEVTFGEWDLCTKDGVCPQVKDGGQGRGNRPVANVSWDDAQTYIGWLNKRIPGAQYRLPREAEWEYASRAGSNDTAYSWGYVVGKGNANCRQDQCSDAFGRTAPIGSFMADGYGLYDMHGNVWEWCQDRFGYYSPSPSRNPNGAESGNYRVLRGGSWQYNAQYLRSAYRLTLPPDFRDISSGFRLAHPWVSAIKPASNSAVTTASAKMN
ncbi:MAG: formylglycine-generating enzyme family protein [Thiothrix sp.]|uniref:formylglycine-generating enzyme family protein n=1 Tax=Thiothrix sp. TaxID=1032 RepID=UPI002635AA85|nr:formylglycine-generating enzyme family protein [Thiothrix sp.]MDD5395334.1 formylglycine-generating enzyme family protein [Thiothrix sp.]